MVGNRLENGDAAIVATVFDSLAFRQSPVDVTVASAAENGIDVVRLHDLGPISIRE